MEQLENNIGKPLLAGVIFTETAELAHKVQRMGPRMTREERTRFESLLAECESEKIYSYLTEDEKKKIKLWRMMMTLLEG